LFQKRNHLSLLKAHHDRGVHNANVNEVHEEYKKQLGLNGKLATALTAVYGSMYFVYFLAFGSCIWMLVQYILGKNAFDPLPFALLLLIGNFVQLFGGPIIQVGQNLGSAHSELRAESDHYVTEESFKKLNEILTLLREENRSKNDEKAEKEI
jgi:uncharacterized membrane protein